MNDTERWIAEARAGSTAAFNRLVDGYERPSYHIALYVTGSPKAAARAWQAAVRAAWEDMPDFQGDGQSLWPWWLAQVVAASRELSSESGAEAAAPAPSSEPSPHPAPGEPAAHFAERASVERLLGSALARLAVDDRAVLLASVATADHRELAVAVDTSADVVKGRLARARRALQAQLERSAPHPPERPQAGIIEWGAHRGAAGGGHIGDEDLSTYLDDALPAPRRIQLEAHLAVCERCASASRSLARTVDYLRALPPATVPPDARFLLPSVAAAPARTLVPPPSTAQAALVGLAAVVAVAGLLAVGLLGGATNGTAPVLSDSPAAPPATNRTRSVTRAQMEAPTSTQPGYPVPLSTALAADRLRGAARAVWVATLAASTPRPGATTAAMANLDDLRTALAATEAAARHRPTEPATPTFQLAGADGAPTSGPLPVRPSPAPQTPAAGQADATVARRPEWQFGVALALLCLALAVLLLGRRRHR